MAASDVAGRLNAALAGRYAIQRELGRGGMATIFLAEDPKHHRPVAIKVLDPEVAAAIGPERFLREIESAAQLTHPHDAFEQLAATFRTPDPEIQPLIAEARAALMSAAGIAKSARQ